MIENSGITVEAVKKIQKDWAVTILKSKLDSKKTTRKDFDSMPFMWRSKYIRSGGKVVDSK